MNSASDYILPTGVGATFAGALALIFAPEVVIPWVLVGAGVGAGTHAATQNPVTTTVTLLAAAALIGGGLYITYKL